MSKYYATYKCLMCGTLIRYGGPKEVPEHMKPELLGKVVQNWQFQSNPALYKAPQQIPHSCKSGDFGLAWFAGFMKE